MHFSVKIVRRHMGSDDSTIARRRLLCAKGELFRGCNRGNMRIVLILLASGMLLHFMMPLMNAIGLTRRPPEVWRPRQLLVVGAPGSGTGQMAKSLAALGLDIEHESSNGHDGTVSWIHGMRLLEGEPDVELLCLQPRLGIDWHPMVLEPGHCPDACRQGCWDLCWVKTCPQVLRRQHGCHRSSDGSRLCLPHFKVTLLQVRHPLATIASSVRGFCDGGMPNLTVSLLVRKMQALVPSPAWAAVRRPIEPNDPPIVCVCIYIHMYTPQ